MHAAQDGLCAICKNVDKLGRNLAIDHCHRTGRVRALLCTRCNIRVGVLEKFGKECAEYLARFDIRE